jgi:hypothetical protein
MSNETTPSPSSFEALLGEIGADLVKAMPTTGENLEADGEKTEGAGEDGEDDEGKGDVVAKSLMVTLADGTQVPAIDGEALIKSIMDRVETNEGLTVTMLRSVVDAFGKQGEMIKSLQGEVVALSNSGKGRKAVIAVTERPAPAAEDLAKSTANQITADEFMAKAMIAQGTGAISGTQVAIAEAHLNSGQAPPKDIVQAVMAATTK